MTTSQLTDSEQQLTDALSEERELRVLLVEALESLEDGWVRREARITFRADGHAWDYICSVCDHDVSAGPRAESEHQSGCPVPPAYAALEAARTLEAKS